MSIDAQRSLMPLMDHFHEPLYPRHSWDSFLANWSTRLADALTELVPRGFVVEEFCPGTADSTRDTVEILVTSSPGRVTVGAIVLVSPRNRDSPAGRQAFAAKCVSYLRYGVFLVVMDIVTTGRVNFHNEIIRLIELDLKHEMLDDGGQYAVAYGAARREGRHQMDVWLERFAVGDPLPTLPLRLTGDLFVPINFEAAYQEACQKRRLA